MVYNYHRGKLMKTLLKVLTYLSTLLGIMLFLRPADNSYQTLLWVPKLVGAALSPLMRVTSVFGALLGILRGDWKLAAAGILGAGLSNKFIKDLPNSDIQYETAFGSDRVAGLLEQNYPMRNKSQLQPSLAKIDFQRDVICGLNPHSGSPLLADLWQPGEEIPPSGLGVVYAHGSGWRVGDKDMLTRHFFEHLARQGHVVLDLAYSLWPQCDLSTMVAEFNQAILWLKENSATLQINPERIIAMGGSAGGHLALLAAYAANQPEFNPLPVSGDTSVRGVVAYYPPADLQEIYSQAKKQEKTQTTKVDQAAQGMMRRIFNLHTDTSRGVDKNDQAMSNSFVELLGGTPDEVPEAYQLLSPIQHVGPHCPPTLLLQGSDDVFHLAPGVRRLHNELQAAGAASILVEYPHTEHGFDLVLPPISPVARSATREVERFLSLLA
jgi:acetyl esterase/lipase